MVLSKSTSTAMPNRGHMVIAAFAFLSGTVQCTHNEAAGPNKARKEAKDNGITEHVIGLFGGNLLDIGGNPDHARKVMAAAIRIRKIHGGYEEEQEPEKIPEPKPVQEETPLPPSFEGIEPPAAATEPKKIPRRPSFGGIERSAAATESKLVPPPNPMMADVPQESEESKPAEPTEEKEEQNAGAEARPQTPIKVVTENLWKGDKPIKFTCNKRKFDGSDDRDFEERTFTFTFDSSKDKKKVKNLYINWTSGWKSSLKALYGKKKKKFLVKKIEYEDVNMVVKTADGVTYQLKNFKDAGIGKIMKAFPKGYPRPESDRRRLVSTPMARLAAETERFQ